MRALFWFFPSILSIGEKGEMIRRSKQELGEIASKMWKDAKIAGDADGRNLMALMCMLSSSSSAEPQNTDRDHLVRADKASGHRMSEDQVVAQMRTTISAGYETVSAIIAVSVVLAWFDSSSTS